MILCTRAHPRCLSEADAPKIFNLFALSSRRFADGLKVSAPEAEGAVRPAQVRRRN